MKSTLIKITVIGICLAFYAAEIAGEIKSEYKNIRSDYFAHAKGRAQTFIISCVQ